jgi:HEAT repeat protein
LVAIGFGLVLRRNPLPANWITIDSLAPDRYADQPELQRLAEHLQQDPEGAETLLPGIEEIADSRTWEPLVALMQYRRGNMRRLVVATAKAWDSTDNFLQRMQRGAHPLAMLDHSRWIFSRELGYDGADIREAAVYALSRMDPVPTAATPYLLHELKSIARSNPDRTSTMEGLIAALCASATPRQVLPLLADPATREVGLSILHTIGNADILPGILPLLSDPDKEIRTSATSAATQVASRDWSAAETISLALVSRLSTEPDESIRIQLVDKLSYLHCPGAMEPLRTAARMDPCPEVRKKALATLFYHFTATDVKNPRWTEDLRQALSDPSQDVRLEAISHFGWRPCPDAGQWLLALAKSDPWPECRWAATAKFASGRWPLDNLDPFLSGKDPWARLGALYVGIRAGRKDLIPAMLDLFRTETDPRFRSHCLEHISELSIQEAIPLIGEELIQTTDPNLAQAMLVTLLKMSTQDRPTWPEMGAALRNPDGEVCNAALIVLGYRSIPPGVCREALEAFLRRGDLTPFLRERATALLAREATSSH